jgi:hypothetical protein
MLSRDRLYEILPLLLSSIVLSSTACIMPLAGAKHDTSTFLTYNNTDLGFTIKYPSNWTVEKINAAGGDIQFISSDRAALVGVSIHKLENITTEKVAAFMNATADQFVSSLLSHQRLVEMDPNGHFLSGKPAIRVMLMQSYVRPSQLKTPQYPEPHDVKTMGYLTIVGRTMYKVVYSVTPPEDFFRYFQMAQSLIDSFQIISKP